MANKCVKIFLDKDADREFEDIIVEANGQMYYSTIGVLRDNADVVIKLFANNQMLPHQEALKDRGKCIAVYSYDTETEKAILCSGNIN